ncbi:putative SnRNP Sm-like protein [Giardia muris]|uniref:Putative SnRNP Sm-like protein n=1 Tax=Giardia muris TaxID=5742 RepID=A0A4Z1SW92_GIAMU|nr:putative SnRNP Sm-like protein [Giardia muris]|eukprot:TNJ30044.1 putative SnRNP Sm-like protein [Giardia muris]
MTSLTPAQQMLAFHEAGKPVLVKCHDTETYFVKGSLAGYDEFFNLTLHNVTLMHNNSEAQCDEIYIRADVVCFVGEPTHAPT